MNPVPDRLRLLPDLDILYAQICAEEDFLGQLIEAQRPFSPTSLRSPFESARSDAPPRSPFQRAVAERGPEVVEKIRRDGASAELDEEESDVFEAIIALTGRPALFFKQGAFVQPPAKWEILETFRAEIETNALSVGRIEVEGHPERDWWGTGFLVTEEVVMTNRHIANKFCHQDESGVWQFKPEMIARIDYLEEVDNEESAEFELTEIIGIHEDPDVDMALFRMSTTSASGATPPAPLQFAPDTQGIRLGSNLYLVGYPAYDERNNVSAMIRIFGNVFDVKRLQPGEIRGVLPQPSWLMHDCSTLGGNSGSCVIDLNSNRVLGLHFKGSYRETNYAVALWRLQNDPLVQKAGLQFG